MSTEDVKLTFEWLHHNLVQMLLLIVLLSKLFVFFDVCLNELEDCSMVLLIMLITCTSEIYQLWMFQVWQ